MSTRISAATLRKFHNTPTEYGGVIYHSAKEANYAAELDFLKRAGEIKEWFRQVRIPLYVNGKLICTIVIDFMFRDRKEKETYVEVKGAETALWKLKWKLFETLYPQYKKIVVK